MDNTTLYRGRFAPSPTGPLHFGSLVALTGSYLDARHANGEWHLRMEDLDPPREIAGAADDIVRTVELLGAQWDGPVLLQSQRLERYQECLETLQSSGVAYACTCSRKEIADHGLAGVEGPIYPGTCRGTQVPQNAQHAWRVRTNNQPSCFNDLVQGQVEQRLEAEVGDFIVRRSDLLFAYQLAVVIDDAEQAISHVVRGCDLLLSTPRQLHLQSLLKFPAPAYVHLPVAVNQQGQKLSKQTGAAPLDLHDPVRQIIAAMRFLGQKPPAELHDASLDECWAWGIAHWDRSTVPAHKTQPILDYVAPNN